MGTFEREMETIWERGCCKEECQDRDKSGGKGNSGLETSKSGTKYIAEMKKVILNQSRQIHDTVRVQRKGLDQGGQLESGQVIFRKAEIQNHRKAKTVRKSNQVQKEITRAKNTYCS